MPIKGLKGGIGSKALGYGLGGAAQEATDAEFNQTVLLLHGDGSEGEGDTAALGDPNYKAFKDNSTSAHAITVQGDAYGNDFSPYYYANGYWSIESNTSSMVEIDGSSFPALGTDDFTIEAWVYFNDGSSNTFYDSRPSGVDGAYSSLRVGSNAFRYWSNSADRITGSTKSPHTWYHVALVRSSGSTKLYVDGTQEGSTYSDSANYVAATDRPRLGNRNGTGFNGYLSNLRVVKGTAIYTSNFTPPTAPLTAVTNTELLICQSNRFLDNSSSSHSLSITGTPKVSTNTPFTVTKTANVGSGFFDGTNDNAQIPESTDTRLSSSDFTFECWFYGTSNTSANKNLFSQGASGAYSPLSVYYYGNGVRWNASSNGSSYDVINDTTTYGTNGHPNQWNHVAACREGSNFALFLNGTRVNTVTSSATLMTPSQNTSMGSRPTNDADYDGYISDWRLVIGSTIYDPTSSTITLPTTSLTDVTNTKILTCQYSGAVRNVGFLDDSKYNHQITRGGDVSMGTFSPFSLEDGYWSNYFASGSNLDIANSTDLLLGTGDYTIEGWFWSENTGSQKFVVMKGINAAGGFLLGVSQDYIDWRYNSTATTSINQGTGNGWAHIAVTRTGGDVKIFLNGQIISDTTNGGAIDYTDTSDLEIGSVSGLSAIYRFVGSISNFRFVKGTALYTSAFTPSTSPFTTTSQSATASEVKILTCQSNRFVDNSNTSNTINVTATPKVQPFSPFAPTRSYSKDAVGGSAYFDGSSDGLNAGTSEVFLPKANTDFTFEAWVYLTATPGAQGAQIMGVQEYGTNSDWIFYVGSDLVTDLWIQAASSGAGVTYAGSTAIKLNEWNHIAWSRSGTGSNNMKLFINGVQDAQYTYTGTMKYNGSTGLTLGSDGAFDEALLTGYMSNPRIINGTGLYTSAFTPPTAPFLDSDSNYDNTTFLARFDNAGIIDHTMRNNLETEGNVRISGQQTKFGTGSMYFDGTGDYLQLPFSENFNFHTGSFTWEAWVYPTNVSGIVGMYATSGGAGVTNKFAFHLNAGTPSVHYNGVGINDVYHTATSAISANTWTYLAFVFDGTTWTWYINGVASGTGSQAGLDLSFTTEPTYVGYGGESYFAPFNGYIDELRVTKGVARYTSNFTAPTKAFANR